MTRHASRGQGNGRDDDDFSSVDETRLGNLDRATSLLRLNGTKDEPYKSMSRDDKFTMINTNF